jgi:hypothetical protein
VLFHWEESFVLVLIIAGYKLEATQPKKDKLHSLDPDSVEDPKLRRRIKRAKNSKTYHEQIKKELAAAKQKLIEMDAEMNVKDLKIAQLEGIIAGHCGGTL